jgi:DNA processing protein
VSTDVWSRSPGDLGYPDGLLSLERPPAPLFGRGEMPDGHKVAIVGARKASELGRALAEELAFDLATVGVTVVSGGALGIDIAAHRGALRAGGRTVVVLPTCIEEPVPRLHLRDFKAILATGGAWVSEWHGPPKRRAFCERNRIIAALSDFVVLVEARACSGTRYTLDAALSLGRPFGAYPWTIGDSRGEASLAAFRAGGFAVASRDDVLRRMQADFSMVPEPDRAFGPTDHDDLASRLWVFLADDAQCTADELCDFAKASPQLVLGALSVLEVEGWIESAGNGQFRRRRRR